MTQEEIGNGLASVRSAHSVDETLQRLRTLLDSKGVTVFALVDHSGEAGKVGMAMPPTKLLLFGNPAAGTPVMLARPGIAIDLPLKILIREDGDGAVWLMWNDAEYLQQRHQIPEALTVPLRAAELLARQVAA
jgi:uncharacterized protein (DUF302 family)